MKLSVIHHVHNLKIQIIKKPPSYLKNSLNQEIKLDFDAGNYHFETHLRLFENLWDTQCLLFKSFLSKILIFD